MKAADENKTAETRIWEKWPNYNFSSSYYPKIFILLFWYFFWKKKKKQEIDREFPMKSHL